MQTKGKAVCKIAVQFNFRKTGAGSILRDGNVLLNNLNFLKVTAKQSQQDKEYCLY